MLLGQLWSQHSSQQFLAAISSSLLIISLPPDHRKSSNFTKIFLVKQLLTCFKRGRSFVFYKASDNQFQHICLHKRTVDLMDQDVGWGRKSSLRALRLLHPESINRRQKMYLSKVSSNKLFYSFFIKNLQT